VNARKELALAACIRAAQWTMPYVNRDGDDEPSGDVKAGASGNKYSRNCLCGAQDRAVTHCKAPSHDLETDEQFLRTQLAT